MKGKEDVTKLTDQELAESLTSLKGELFNLRFQLATGALDNPMRIREVRRQIARVRTQQRGRELRIRA